MENSFISKCCNLLLQINTIPLFILNYSENELNIILQKLNNIKEKYNKHLDIILKNENNTIYIYNKKYIELIEKPIHELLIYRIKRILNKKHPSTILFTNLNDIEEAEIVIINFYKLYPEYSNFILNTEKTNYGIIIKFEES